MPSPSTHSWLHPFEAAHNLGDTPELVLYYSGLAEHHTGRYSLLAWGLEQAISTSRWDDIASHLCAHKQWHEQLWFGWLGYGMRLDSEPLTRGQPSPISLPDCRLMRFGHVLRFDHREQQVEYYHTGPADRRWQQPASTHDAPEIQVAKIASPLSKAEYTAIVRATIRQIEAGAFYQANITRKFTGQITRETSYLPTFIALCEQSPAPYSAYIRDGRRHILSSSPECFLTIDASGKMLSRPIKGSAARGDSPAEDAQIRHWLNSSGKNHAENRMIVDLMRNDLARSACAGSVRASAAAELTSYNTVHHLISTIIADKRVDIPTIRAIEACFPPGSMTGAPKIAAMHWCDAQERYERGLYSGALGWFGGDGSCDLSVVIRTLLIEDGRFEFQVGGGIVADSDPESEWQETLIKARGIARTLGIAESTLAAL